MGITARAALVKGRAHLQQVRAAAKDFAAGTVVGDVALDDARLAEALDHRLSLPAPLEGQLQVLVAVVELALLGARRTVDVVLVRVREDVRVAAALAGYVHVALLAGGLQQLVLHFLLQGSLFFFCFLGPGGDRSAL
jgi:hypothetical protein